MLHLLIWIFPVCALTLWGFTTVLVLQYCITHICVFYYFIRLNEIYAGTVPKCNTTIKYSAHREESTRFSKKSVNSNYKWYILICFTLTLHMIEWIALGFLLFYVCPLVPFDYNSHVNTLNCALRFAEQLDIWKTTYYLNVTQFMSTQF